MIPALPKSVSDLLAWTWPEIEPLYQHLTTIELTSGNVHAWLKDWTDLANHVDEQFSRLYVATTVNTEDASAAQALQAYLDSTYVKAPVYEQQLKTKLIGSGLEPEVLAVPLRNLRAEVDLFRDENLPLLAEEIKISTDYDKLSGARTVVWEGKERTIPQMNPVFVEEKDRSRRESAWRLVQERILQDREANFTLWRRYFPLREQIARNAGKPSYREFAWQQKLRFDYTPDDCKDFHAAIEQVVVPAATRIYERRRRQLRLDTLRPWDLAIDPLGRPPLKPFEDVAQLIEGSARIFDRLDPVLSRHYRIMMEEDLLDLDNRKGKAPGGYCTAFAVQRRPFIFMNAVGLHDDFQTLLHEAGHAFHVFEASRLPYFIQLSTPMEFNEVASMAMELLAAPYLTDSGLYNQAQAARARIEHIESLLLFWPYMACVDAFQHWIYENPDQGRDPENLDVKWCELWDRFHPGIDYSGLEDYKPARWHRQLHIHQVPFYYIEYGLAQLGAVQVWGNALADQTKAVEDYRRALALGATVTLPELFATAGARFAFDAATLKKYVDLAEAQIQVLAG